MSDIKYRVRKPFKATVDGEQRDFKAGDIIDELPPDGKWNEQLISTGYIAVVDERIETLADRRRKLKKRHEDVEVNEKRRAVYAMRTQKPPLTWEIIAKMVDVSETTARKYFNQEKAKREKGKKDVKSNPRGAGKSGGRKASSSKG